MKYIAMQPNMDIFVNFALLLAVAIWYERMFYRAKAA
jgi:hypothetical protein